ncbi:MAG: hypothetical protein IKX23_06395 [Treponema sp.]|nr:hypothetical protein [Treponema sp.]
MTKNKNTTNKTKKFNINKKYITIIACSFSAVVLIIILLISFTLKNKDSRVHIAFYGIENEYVEQIEKLFYSQVSDKNNKKYIVTILENGPVNYKNLSKKYDLVFAWKGEVTSNLENSAKDIPSKLLDSVPETMKNKKILPLLIDNCELAYSKKTAIKFGGELPLNLHDFEEYLAKTKDTVITPFVCEGADDKILTSLVVNLIEKTGGISAYEDFIESLHRGTDLAVLLDQKLGKNSITLRQVLMTLAEWNRKGLLFNGWYNIKQNDLKFFVEEYQTSVFFTYLSRHRKKAWNVMNEYEAYLLPPADGITETGIIAPTICVMLFTKNKNAKIILDELFTKRAQEILSDGTKLAPVYLRARAYDKQSEDVRFWAAGSLCGALPDVYNAAFQTNPEKFAEFAQKIRILLQIL